MAKIKQDRLIVLPKELFGDTVWDENIIKETNYLVIDFKKVKTIDIQGLTFINEQLENFECKDVCYEFRNVSPEIRELFEIIGILY